MGGELARRAIANQGRTRNTPRGGRMKAAMSLMMSLQVTAMACSCCLSLSELAGSFYRCTRLTPLAQMSPNLQMRNYDSFDCHTFLLELEVELEPLSEVFL